MDLRWNAHEVNAHLVRKTKEYVGLSLARLVLFFSRSILRKLRVRILDLEEQHIGHLVLRPLAFEQALCNTGPEAIRLVFMGRRSRSANEAVFDIVRGRFRVIRVVGGGFFTLAARRWFPDLTSLLDNSELGTYKFQVPTTLFTNLPSELSGLYLRPRLGFDPAMPWICIHVRDREYKGPSHRDATISHFYPFIIAAIRQGVQVVRMGRFADKVDNLEIQGYFKGYKLAGDDEEFELFLWSRCTYVLGTVSGALEIPKAMGRPIGLTNSLPAHIYASLGDVFTPKRFWWHGKALTLEETLDHFLWLDGGGAEPLPSGLEVAETSAHEICWLAEEVKSRVRGAMKYSARDEGRQDLFWSIAKSYAPFEHWTANKDSRRVGNRFLRVSPAWLA